MVCNSDGSLFVTDQYLYKVKAFDGRGTFLSEFGRRGKNSTDFQGGPSHIDCWAETIAVADLGTAKVLFSSTNGRFIDALTVPSPVTDIAFDRYGRLYVSVLTN